MKKETLFVLVLLSVFVFACSSSANNDSKSAVVSEFNTKQADVNASLDAMSIPLQRWNGFFTKKENGETRLIYAEDFHTTYREFSQKANTSLAKINDFEKFIDNNDAELKKEKIDTVSVKNNLEIIKEAINNKLNSMKKYLENIPEQ